MNFLTADVAIIVDASKVPAQLAMIKSATTRTATKMEGAFRRMSRASDRAFAKIARATRYAAIALAAAGVSAVKMAADVQDSEDFFVMSMGNMADSTREWSNELAESLELNQYEVRETVAVFNEMTTAMGLNAEAAAEMSQRYTQLAYDLVSFHPKVRNLEQASTVLQAALTGERESLKRLGYYYSETEVALEAVRLGYGKNTKALTALQKLKINDVIITRKMINVQGDLRRTLDSSQNVFRAVWTQVKLLGIAFGDKLRPAITETAIAIKDWIKENKAGLIVWANIWIKRIGAIAKALWDWRKEFGIIIAGLVLLPKFIMFLGGIATSTWAVVVAFAAFGAAIMHWGSVLLGFVALTGAWTTGLWSFLGLIGMKIHFTRMAYIAIIALSAKVVTQLVQWQVALRNLIGLEEKLAAVVERAARRRKELAESAKADALIRRFALAEELRPTEIPGPGDIRDPFVAAIPEDQKRFEQMKAALEFEFDMLGKINDVRERAEELSKVQVQIDSMANLTAEERNQKMEDYVALLDRIVEKQRGFGHTIQLWINDSIEWGKNLGNALTSAFDGASDALTELVLTGKDNFRSLANSVVKDISRMIIQAEMAQAIGILMPGLSGGGGAYGGRGLLGGLFGGGGEAIPSAQSGGRVEKTGLAKIHKGETVSGVSKNNGGNTVNINVSAVDAAGSYQFLNENKALIATMLEGTIASNHSLRRNKNWK